MVNIDEGSIKRYNKAYGKPILIIEGLPFEGNVFCVIDHKIQDPSQNRYVNEFTVVDITNKATGNPIESQTFCTFVDSSAKKVLQFKDSPNVNWCMINFSDF